MEIFCIRFGFKNLFTNNLIDPASYLCIQFRIVFGVFLQENSEMCCSRQCQQTLVISRIFKGVVLGKYNTQKDSCVDKSNMMIESLLSLDYTNFVNTIFHLVF